MKKIIISSDSNVEILSSFFDLVYDYSSDASLALQVDVNLDKDNSLKAKSSGIQIVGISRFNKIEQVEIMDQYEIGHPKSFYDKKKLEPFKNLDIFNSYVDLDEFVVKPILGARGIGVKKVTRKEYEECIDNPKLIDNLFHKENEYVKENCSDVSTEYINENFSLSLIQESINVDREFRLIIFKGADPIYYERIKSENQFCGNLSHGSKAKDVSKETFSKFLSPIVKDFEGLMDDFSYPWLSIDVYVSDNGDIGVFEFQMEFTYKGFDHKVIRDSMKKSIEFYL